MTDQITDQDTQVSRMRRRITNQRKELRALNRAMLLRGEMMKRLMAEADRDRLTVLVRSLRRDLVVPESLGTSPNGLPCVSELH